MQAEYPPHLSIQGLCAGNVGAPGAAPCREERGIALIFVAILIPIILMIGIAVYEYGAVAILEGELQVGVDSAAHAGGSTLCSSRTCWQQVRSVVLETLKHQNLRTRDGALDFTSINLNEEIPYWVTPQFSLRIYRGRWWPHGVPAGYAAQVSTLPEAPRFEPFETDSFPPADWQAAHPTVPNFLAANAVYVDLELSAVPWWFQFMRSGTRRTRTSAVAIGGSIEAVRVAPFAVPVCSLIDQNGELRHLNGCGFDRYFTVAGQVRANPFCPDQNLGCKVSPNFYFQPLANDGSFWSSRLQPAPEAFGEVSGTANHCSLAAPAMETLDDHFGVIGVPESSGFTASEGDIQTIINNGGGVNTFIGDLFNVLPGGLTQPATDLALWRRLIGNSGAPDVGQILSFKDVNIQSVELRSRTPTGTVEQCGLLAENAAYRNENWAPLLAPYWGACNSKRATIPDTAWGSVSYPATTCADSNLLPEFIDLDGNGDPRDYFRTPLWRAPVPVIAALNGRGCTGIDPASPALDPGYDPASPYVVIGFVNLAIYDTDIGAPPPELPSVLTRNSDGTTITCTPADEWNRANPAYFRDDDGDGQATDPAPWGFDWNIDGAPDSCNVVRARLECRPGLIPSAEFGEAVQRTPRITQ